MNRGVNRQRTFFADVDRVEFGQRLADVHERFGVRTLAYCLMDNHYHLLLHDPAGELSRAMHHLGLVYTRRTNDRIGRDGPLFRGRFHSIPVTTDEYLLMAVHYIHRNPLDLPGVRSADEYRWSSLRAYLGRRPPAPFMDLELVLGLYGDDRDAFAASALDDAPPQRWSDVDDVVQLVRFAIAVDDIAHGLDHDVPRWLERTVLLLVSEGLDGHPLGQRLVDWFGFPSEKARRMAMHRARSRSATPAINRSVSTVLASLERSARSVSGSDRADRVLA
jgi:REP element-mobilizing transposase RayT